MTRLERAKERVRALFPDAVINDRVPGQPLVVTVTLPVTFAFDLRESQLNNDLHFADLLRVRLAGAGYDLYLAHRPGGDVP